MAWSAKDQKGDLKCSHLERKGEKESLTRRNNECERDGKEGKEVNTARGKLGKVDQGWKSER